MTVTLLRPGSASSPAPSRLHAMLIGSSPAARHSSCTALPCQPDVHIVAREARDNNLNVQSIKT